MLSEFHRQLFADTSFFYAVLDPDDDCHKEALEISDWVKSNFIQLVSTWEIVLETVTLLRYRHSYQTSMIFIQDIFPSLQLIPVTETDRQEALKLFEKFSSDKKISLCDVISYLMITKYLKRLPSLAFDEDFQSLGLIPFRIPKEEGS